MRIMLKCNLLTLNQFFFSAPELEKSQLNKSREIAVILTVKKLYLLTAGKSLNISKTEFLVSTLIFQRMAVKLIELVTLNHWV